MASTLSKAFEEALAYERKVYSGPTMEEKWYTEADHIARRRAEEKAVGNDQLMSSEASTPPSDHQGPTIETPQDGSHEAV